MVWVYWTSDSSSTSTSTCSHTVSENYTWQHWQTCTITNCTTDATTGERGITIWGEWNQGTLTIYGNNSTWSDWVVTGDECHVGKVNYQQVRPPTEEERKTYEQERIRMEELAREREKKAREAEEKALQLLLENLTENQRAIYESTGAIPIECQSGRKYHIRKGISQNVHELDEKGHTARRLCFHPSDCPVYDVMLAQKLMLESCEEEARGIANFSN